LLWRYRLWIVQSSYPKTRGWQACDPWFWQSFVSKWAIKTMPTEPWRKRVRVISIGANKLNSHGFEI
jgi:hypothetical protein